MAAEKNSCFNKPKYRCPKCLPMDYLLPRTLLTGAIFSGNARLWVLGSYGILTYPNCMLFSVFGLTAGERNG